MTFKRALLATTAATLLATGFAELAMAQGLQIEEIVVTARKREESLQDVPLSIAAFSSKDLKEIGIASVYDLEKFTPNFAFDKAFGRRFDRPIIRGQSSVISNDLASFFVDGVYVSSSIATVSTEGLERVEVLRGPQSALYGRAAFSGAINYVTKQPSNEFEGQVNTKVGSHSDYKGAMWMRGPIVEDRLQYFLSGNWEYYGGQYRNNYPGTTPVGNSAVSRGPVNSFISVPFKADTSRVGKEETRNVTAKLRFLPSENLEFNLKANYNKAYDSVFASVFILGSENNCFRPGIDAGTPTFTPGNVSRSSTTLAGVLGRGYNCGELKISGRQISQNLEALRTGVTVLAVNLTPVNTSQANPATFGTANPAFGTLLLQGGQPITIYGAPAKPGQFRETGNFVGDIQFNYSDWDILAQATYNADKAEFNLDSDRFAANGPSPGLNTVIEGAAIGSQSHEVTFDYSGEFRVTSPQEDRLRGIAGAYYFNRDARNRSRSIGGNNLSANFWGVGGQNYSLSYVTYKAVFGSAEFDINDQLTIGAEGRYGQDKRSIPFNIATTRPVLSSIKKFTPRLHIDYKVTPETLLYATYAVGTLPGGFNANAFTRVNVTDADFARLESEDKTLIDSEKNVSYELGVKTSLMDNRASINADVFYIDWTKQKLNQIEPIIAPGPVVNGVATTIATSINIQRNSGVSRVQGIEFSGQLLATDNLTLTAGYGMADHVFKKANDDMIEANGGPKQDFTFATGNGNAAGKHNLAAPKHSATAGFAWRDDLTADAQWLFRTDLSYQSKKYSEIANISWVGARTLVNSKIGVETKTWNLTLYANNLFDDRTPGAAFRGADSSVARYAGNPFANRRALELSMPRGREFGLTGEYNF